MLLQPEAERAGRLRVAPRGGARRQTGGWILPLAALAILGGWLALVFAVGAAPLAKAAAPARGKAAVAIVAKAAGDATVYRFYNSVTGVHFYTADETERAAIIAQWPQLVFEGPVYRAWTTAAAGTTPIYRFFNTKTGAHFYTADPAEKLRVEQTMQVFVYEGIVFYAYPSDAFDRQPVHRFYNNATQTHFFTTSDAEKAYIQSHWPQFIYEGIAYYALPLTGDAASLARRDAFRLLDQATFGPTPATVAQVLQSGSAAWVDAQLALPASGYPASEFWYVSLDENDNCKFSAPRKSDIYACARDQLSLFKLRRQFFVNALTAPDQLRQRVAWALSQILVISGMKDPDMETGYVQARYQQILAEEALGNFGSLLTRATLSPAMGHYLDMVDNAKANPQEMTEPNENYARELLQLFSIGLVELKRDGTPLTDAQGNPIPTYGQAEVKAFARALTGWTYPPYDGAQPKGGDDGRYYAKPMVAVQREHDTGSKPMLNGIVLPAGQTAEGDVQSTLANVFLHPNVAPFIGRQLIRHLVTGNPTPAYVDRVAAVFENNGAGVRGDMKAVVRAILLDPEARGFPDGNPSYGRFRDPALFVTAVLRALGAASDGIGLDEATKSMGQDVFYSPTVFNYFPAEFKIPGTSVIAPPMGIHNTNTVLARSNFVYGLLYDGGLQKDDEVADATGTALAIAPYAALAGDPRTLVAELNSRLFGGAMPAGVQSEIFNTLVAMDSADAEERARAALFLAATSFQYQVAR
jgi:uncharacterized protein (DUF1800 family)